MHFLRWSTQARILSVLGAVGVGVLLLLVIAVYNDAIASAPMTSYSYTWTPPYNDYYTGVTTSYPACSGAWSGAGAGIAGTPSISTGSFQGWAMTEADWVSNCSSNTAQSQLNEGFHVTPNWVMGGVTGTYYIQAEWDLQVNALVIGDGCTGIAQALLSVNVGVWNLSSDSSLMGWVGTPLYDLNDDWQGGDGICQWGTLTSIGYGGTGYMAINELNGNVFVTATTPTFVLGHNDLYIPRSSAVVTAFVNCGNSACVNTVFAGDFSIINAGFNTNVYSGPSTPFTATLEYLEIL